MSKEKFFLKSKIIWKDILLILSTALLTFHDLIIEHIEFIKVTFNGKLLYLIMFLLTLSSIYIRMKSKTDPLTTKPKKKKKVVENDRDSN